MLKTKDKILAAALQLFNEKGFFSVSLRQIALECSISVGNLNYHFKQREDILKALYFNMVKGFDQRLEEGIPSEINRSLFENTVKESMATMYQHRFFWTDLYRLLQVDQSIAEHFNQVHQVRRAGYLELFKNLEEKGLIQEMNQNLKNWTADRMLEYSNTWLYLLQLNNNAPVQESHLPRVLNEKAQVLSTFLPWKPIV